jgi:hypothetical protein
VKVVSSASFEGFNGFMTTAEADKWINFLRGYGPITRNGNQYTEQVGDNAKRAGFKPIIFSHPAEKTVRTHLDPAQGRFQNLVLTGTAGDGKTSLCYKLWEEFGGSSDQLSSMPKTACLCARDGNPPIHFIFDISRWLPEKVGELEGEYLETLGRVAASVAGKSDEVFAIACNDGKLLELCGMLRKHGGFHAELAADLQSLLTGGMSELEGRKLHFLNLSYESSVGVLDLARESILAREEWCIFEEHALDNAYGAMSPLRRNVACLRDDQFYRRLRGLVELCDSNGFHFPIREILLLLVNGLLGHPKAKDFVMTADELRRFSTNQDSPLGAIHRNLFGDNLSSARRNGKACFGFLRLFRVGLETSNEVDNLLLYGSEIESLKPDYRKLVEPIPELELRNDHFHRYRLQYLKEDQLDEIERDRFLSELANERRRVFFRIPESKEGDFHLWQLTVFQNAGRYRDKLLRPLGRKEGVPPSTVEELVRGLNRVWTGMLTEESGYLFLTSGLDYTTARLSRIIKHKVSVHLSTHNEQIVIVEGRNGVPELQVHLLGKIVPFTLNLLRYEFLLRVSEGSLPNSFSRECFEDVVSFKTKLLAAIQSSVCDTGQRINYLKADENGLAKEWHIAL